MSFIHEIDYWLFAALNNLAGRWSWLDVLARLWLNDYFAPTILALMLLALWFEGPGPAAQKNNQRAVLAATLSAASANILLKIMNLLYYRPRPFASHPVNLLFYQPTDSSLPSNAAALGFAIAAGVWFYNRGWGYGMLWIALIFGLSRIFGGVHFPLDVMTGAGLGWGAAWFIYRQKSLVERGVGLVVSLATKLHLT